MAKNPFPNPDFIPWKPEVHAAYLKSARAEYTRKCGDPQARCNESWKHWLLRAKTKRCSSCPPIHKSNTRLLERLYDEGRLQNCIRLTYQDFERWMFAGAPPLYRKVGHHHVSRSGVLEVRCPSKYVKPEVPRPKPVLNASRGDWRDRKGFARDYRKGKPQYGRGRHRSAAKRQSNRIHRQWERRQIFKAKWEDAVSDIRKWTHDSWMYD